MTPDRRTCSRLTALALLALVFVAMASAPAGAQTLLKELPQQKGVGIVEKRGAQVPLALRFTTSRGKQVELRDYFDGRRPVVLVMAYYTCPLLCTKTLNEVQKTLNQLSWTAGQEFRVLTVSFDHRNTVAEAREKQTAYLAGYAREVPESAWDFLVGDVDSIRALSDAVGFHYKFLPESGEFSHPAGLIFLTPMGTVSGYLERMEFPAGDVRLALSDAAENRIGSVFDRVISYCFVYNPHTGRYSLVARRVMAVSGFLTMVVLGAAVASFAVARSRRFSARARLRVPVGGPGGASVHDGSQPALGVDSAA